MTIAPKGAAFAAAMLVTASAADAAVLLTVDIADPLAVSITATGAASSEDVTGFIGNGFTLLGLVNGPVSTAPALASDLTAAGSTQPLQFRYVTTGAGLNLFFASNESYDLDTTSAAFTGSATFDLTGYTLATAGSTGDIRPGDGDFSPLGAVIGSYEVVNSTAAIPLPATGALLLLGLAAPAALARRRSRKS